MDRLLASLTIISLLTSLAACATRTSTTVAENPPVIEDNPRPLTGVVPPVQGLVPIGGGIAAWGRVHDPASAEDHEAMLRRLIRSDNPVFGPIAGGTNIGMDSGTGTQMDFIIVRYSELTTLILRPSDRNDGNGICELVYRNGEAALEATQFLHWCEARFQERFGIGFWPAESASE